MNNYDDPWWEIEPFDLTTWEGRMAQRSYDRTKKRNRAVELQSYACGVVEESHHLLDKTKWFEEVNVPEYINPYLFNWSGREIPQYDFLIERFWDNSENRFGQASGAVYALLRIEQAEPGIIPERIMQELCFVWCDHPDYNPDWYQAPPVAT